MSDIENNVNISITNKAANKISELLKEENNDNLKLRVFITGGGCSGFQYGFTFEDEFTPDDLYINDNDVKMVIDSLSYQYLIGATIDYKEEMLSSQFTISNPNAASTCGCGQSFGV
jgi:Iron-sulfur cluster assembly accessory protein